MFNKIEKFNKRGLSPRFLYVTGFTLIGLLVVSLIFFWLASFKHNYRQVRASMSSEPIKEASANSVLGSPTPSPTVSPSATQSAAPVYSGYCLNVPVIFYHHIEPMAQAKTEGHAQLTVDSSIFDSQMAYLVSRGYNFLTAQQLADGLVNRSGVAGHSIVITMDDGYVDFFNYAYPILQKYHVVASLAIPTGLIGDGGDYMNWDKLKQVIGSGLVSAYNHTWSHANLAGISAQKAQYEVSTAKQQLHDNIGTNSNVFFYPYGGTSNAAISTLNTNGYNVALTTLPGSVQCSSFLMSLHRTRIGNAPLSSYGF